MVEIFAAVAVVLVLAVAGLIAFASRKPDTFSFARSAHVAAAPEAIYPMIANIRAMNTWNPFVSNDPAIELSYSGPESGPGAGHYWNGNRNVGEGRIEVVDATPPRQVVMRLDMIRPMKASNRVEFTLAPDASGTTVTWAMSGANPLMGKIVSCFIDCDAMCTSQFDKGLAKLKSLAEAG